MKISFTDKLNNITKLFKHKEVDPSKQVQIASFDPIITIVLLGEGGKTTCIHKFITSSYKQCCQITLGASFIQKCIKRYNVQSKLNIWDTAGQQRYRSILPIYIKSDPSNLLKVGIVFYDVTDRRSFEITNVFLKIWREHNQQPLSSLVLVANKIDTKILKQEKVSSQEGLNMAKQQKILYLESSSKFQVSHIFETANDLIFIQLDQKYQQIEQEAYYGINKLQNQIFWLKKHSNLIKCLWKSKFYKLLFAFKYYWQNFQRINYSLKAEIFLLENLILSIQQRLKRLYLIQYLQTQSQKLDKIVSLHIVNDFQQNISKLKILQALKKLKQGQNKLLKQQKQELCFMRQKKVNHQIQLIKMTLKCVEDKKKQSQKYLSHCKQFVLDIQSADKHQESQQIILSNSVEIREEKTKISKIVEGITNDLKQISDAMEMATNIWDLIQTWLVRIQPCMSNEELIQQSYGISNGQDELVQIQNKIKEVDQNFINELATLIFKTKDKQQDSIINKITKKQKSSTRKTQLNQIKLFFQQNSTKIKGAVEKLIRVYHNIGRSAQELKTQIQIKKHNMQMMRQRRGQKKQSYNDFLIRQIKLKKEDSK